MNQSTAVSIGLLISGAVLLGSAALQAQETSTAAVETSTAAQESAAQEPAAQEPAAQEPAQTDQKSWDPSTSRQPSFGAGLILGNPSGLTAKYRLSRIHAIDAGVGFGGDLAIYADYIWHGWRVFPQPEKGKLAGYLGVGGRIETKDRRDDEFGIRAVVGAGYWLPKLPMEIFLELVPLFRVTPGSSTGLDVGLGFRYYFAKFD